MEPQKRISNKTATSLIEQAKHLAISFSQQVEANITKTHSHQLATIWQAINTLKEGLEKPIPADANQEEYLIEFQEAVNDICNASKALGLLTHNGVSLKDSTAALHEIYQKKLINLLFQNYQIMQQKVTSLQQELISHRQAQNFSKNNPEASTNCLFANSSSPRQSLLSPTTPRKPKTPPFKQSPIAPRSP